MKKKPLLLIVLPTLVIVIGLFSGYTAWNKANPEKTCARCHEINPSFASWEISAHRDIGCDECHGTAISNGIHSMKEKGNMVFTHLRGKTFNPDIHLTEEQMLATMDNCVRCHRDEYQDWLSGGHSAQYGHIFLNAAHNEMEQPYWDCLRCHGMMYEGNIHDLVDPVSSTGPWHMKDAGQTNLPAIPCLACHQVHTPNPVREPSAFYHLPKEMFYQQKEMQKEVNPAAGLYVRSDRMYLRADLLPEPDIYYKGKKLQLSDDPVQRLCIQCHAPNYRHEAGTQDDRTPAGVHEGISCTACHATHSNNAVKSCSNCHPAISNCKLDVTTMNTTYFKRDSDHNIHFVSCEDCHGKEMKH